MTDSIASSLAAMLKAALDGHEARGGPIYMRLAVVLRHAIQAGRIPTGAGLPPERELAHGLGVSRETVRRAVEQLTEEGLLKARQGSGTYVSARIVEPLSLLASFSEDMERRGFVPGSRWLSRQLVRPTVEEMLALGVSSTDLVMRSARVRTADGEPMTVEHASVNAAHVGGTAEFGDSLYEAMRRNAAAPVRAIQRIRAGVADAETARLLNIGLGAAVLETERRSFTQEGKPLELTRALFRGDMYDYIVEMRIAPS
ncbi:GntR family transcriptional regulator [Variovorax humicola]|uniref:GntR family transcriptional regulator n=1 Tax=Variovorax humicola TaxID=1769758 RepID=A0ABU8W2S4_9BURK